MPQPQADPASEVKRLQRCVNDLVSVLALPAAWNGSEPNRILELFLDALLTMLDLDFLYARVQPGFHDSPIESLKTSQLSGTSLSRQEIRQALDRWFSEDPQLWTEDGKRHLAGQELSVLPIKMGIEGDLGLIVAGSQRADFPEQTERLVLTVAANQLATGLQHAVVMDEQKRVAGELDRRVAERTRELAEANDDLRLQMGLLQHIPVAAWTLRPDGTPDFANQVWLEHTGQTLAFVRSHPEAWLTAVHPEDRETASRSLWDGVLSGQDFAMETRVLRAYDRTYRWHLIRAVVLRDAKGNILKFVGTSTDIDDRKGVEEELRAGENNLRQVLDSIPGLVCTLSPAGEVQLTNRPFLEYFGKTFEQMKDWAHSDAVHPDDLPRVLVEFTHSITTGASYEIEHRLRRADGVYRWTRSSARPVRDSNGRVTGWYVLMTDIDDRKRAEDALRANQHNLSQIINTIPTTAWSTRPDGYCEFLSDRWLHYAGFTYEQAVGWNWAVAIHPDDADGLREYWQSCLASGAPVDTEARIRRFDGVYRWFLFRANPFRDESGTIIKWFGTNVDIEDRKLAENALRASQLHLIRIINTIPMLAWSTLPDGYVEFLNQRWLDFTGLSPEQAGGWGWSVAIHPVDAQGLAEYWQGALDSGGPVDVEARMRRFDGQYRWFLFRAEPLRDESGTIIKWYGTNTDIDDRKRAEEALRIRELNLLQITETIPEMLWSASPEGAIEYCNGRFLDYTGFSLEKVLRDGWMNVLHPDDIEPTVEVWKLCVESGAPYRVEVRTFHAADKSFRWCVTRALPLRDQQGRIVKWHGTVVDMHDWKQAQEELRNTQAELARMMRVMTIGQLTASIAHEVSQPLSGIITNASTCLRMLSSDPPNVDGARETVQRTIRDGKRATDVITRLRTLFSKKQIRIERVDLNEAAREVIALLADELQKNRVTVQQRFHDRLPMVKGDRVQLLQVLLNLLRNASDAMATVNDRPRQLLIRTDADGNHATVFVQDSGVGFDPAVTARLFEAFFTTKQEGMGIGLSLSRSIVEAHRGYRLATRNEGPGSTFAFSIPCDFGMQIDSIL